MFIADSQVHIWAANTPEHPWPSPHPSPPPHRHVPFSKDDLLREMDAAGVQRAILVPPSWVGDNNEVAREAARLHPDRFAVMGRLALNPPVASTQIKTWLDQPGMLGLRLTLRIKSDFSDDWLWAAAEAAQVPIMIPGAKQVQLIDRAAERHPGLKLVVDHLAIPLNQKDEEAFADLDQLLALARRPNVAVKASSMPSYTTDTYPYRRLHPYLRRVYDAFGPRRLFWGTDLTKLPCIYKQAITMFTEEIPWLTAVDKEWIMGRGVCEWIGWDMS